MEDITMKEFTYATETIIETINEAIYNNDMSKFNAECSHAEADAYIAHIDAVDALNKAASTKETVDEYLSRWDKQMLELHYKYKASVLSNIDRTLNELISQIHNLENLNIEIERIEAKEAERECGE